MDIFSHGLWAGAAAKTINFKAKKPLNVWWAAFFGVAPDLFSFGILFVSSFLINSAGRPDFTRTEPPDPTLVPSYIGTLYNYTHSLIIFLIVFLLIWVITRRPVLELGAWALHILMDIPSHSYRFFPTPFLWPLSDFKIDGFSWASQRFLIINYSALIVAYGLIYRHHKNYKKILNKTNPRAEGGG